MGPDTEVQEATLLQRVAPAVVSALIVATLGTGAVTWNLVNVNSGELASLREQHTRETKELRERIKRMEKFAEEGNRCTFRDCVRLESGLGVLESRLDQHDERVAHREALERITDLEEQVRAILNDFSTK